MYEYVKFKLNPGQMNPTNNKKPYKSTPANSRYENVWVGQKGTFPSRAVTNPNQNKTDSIPEKEYDSKRMRWYEVLYFNFRPIILSPVFQGVITIVISGIILYYITGENSK